MKIILLGAGGLAQEIKNYLTDVKIEVFLWEEGKMALFNFKGAEFYAAVGDPILKQRLVSQALEAGLVPALPFIHPSAYVGDKTQLAQGSIVTPGCVLTTRVGIGEHTLININATIGHDTKIEGFCTINPGASIAGNVSIGQGVMVGSNASIREQINIRDYATIGMGAVITRDVQSHSVAVGVPPADRRWGK